MSFIVVTGTGTGIGKTVATATLASVFESRGQEVLPVKPVQTGESAGSGDIITVEKLSGIAGKEWIRYPEPLAPNLASRRAGMPQLNADQLVAWLHSLDAPGRIVLIEGAGGLLVRLNDDTSFADLARRLNAPIVIVTTTGLGSLNSVELTVEAARSRRLSIIGIIGGSLPSNPDLATRLNLTEIPRVTGERFLGSIPAGAGELDQSAFADMAREFNSSIPSY